MRNKMAMIALAAGAALSGCATVQFAPPEVTFAQHDKLDLDAALADVDALATQYRAAARQTADDRQVFEVPAFAATLGALTASALGAGTDVAIAAGAGNTLFNAGKAYYAPKSKAQMYDSALSALYCIQQVALGVKPFAHDTAPAGMRAFATVLVGDDRTFYYLVRNAGRSVERVLSTRLSSAGSQTDAESLAAEFEKKIKAVEAAKKQPPPSQFLALDGGGVPDSVDVLKTMQADLELCVSRAKL